MAYSEVPSQTEVDAFFRSMEARQARRAAKLGELSVGPEIVKRGRTRVEKPEYLATPPPKTVEPAVLYVMDRVNTLSEPLNEQFKRAFRIPATPQAYRAYINAGQKRNLAESATKAAQDGDATRHQRQVEHIADLAQQGAREKYNIAIMRRCALASVYASIESGEPINPLAAQFAGNAIVSYAEGLKPLPDTWKNYSYQKQIDKHIEWVGTYVHTDPEVLRDHRAVVFAVGVEQRREADFWKERYDVAVAVDGYERKTDDDRDIQANVQQLIVDFGYDEARVPVIL